MELLTGDNDHGRRLDRVLRKALPDCPLPLIHKLLRKGLILVNEKPASAQTRVVKGSRIMIPRLSNRKITKKSLKNDAKSEIHKLPVKKTSTSVSENDVHLHGKRTKEPIAKSKSLPIEITEPKKQQERKDNAFQKNNTIDTIKKPPISKLNVKFYHPPEILWQNSDLIAFNKPAGLAVHGQVSLDRMVQALLINKVSPSLSFKPGPLHRLDKPSSGIVMFSASLEGANLFSNLMREHKIKKTYTAIVEGTVKKKHYWTDYLTHDKEKKKTFIMPEENKENFKKTNSKIAVTMVIPVSTAIIDGKPYTLISAEIETGRTHQIRAQTSYHGYPLAGDRKYGGHIFKYNTDNSFFLHASKMKFCLGGTEHEIEAPLPAEFQKLADTVFK